MANSKPGLKILMLHGYTQSGALFRAKTRALEKNLVKAFPQYLISLLYPTAPLRLLPADIPTRDAPEEPLSSSANLSLSILAVDDAFAWWKRSGSADVDAMYLGLDESLDFLAGVLQHEGPFDGVLGFSQGGAMAGILASLLEGGRRDAVMATAAADGAGERFRYPMSFCLTEKSSSGSSNNRNVVETPPLIHPPLKFAVSYSGFANENPYYSAILTPPIRTPILHFIGSMDTVVDERRCLLLANACAPAPHSSGSRVVYHPGGHFVPASQREWVGALVGFVREVLEQKITSANKEGKVEESKDDLDDLDLPFGGGRL